MIVLGHQVSMANWGNLTRLSSQILLRISWSSGCCSPSGAGRTPLSWGFMACFRGTQGRSEWPSCFYHVLKFLQLKILSVLRCHLRKEYVLLLPLTTFEKKVLWNSNENRSSVSPRRAAVGTFSLVPGSVACCVFNAITRTGYMYYVLRSGVFMLASIIFKSLAIQSLSENNHFSNTGARGPWGRGKKK